ncbi:MAG: YcxB family protein [Lachnospirales bacterium]
MEFLVKTDLGKTEIMAYQKVSCKTVQKLKMTAIHWGLIGFGLIGLTASGAALGVSRGGAGAFLGIALSTLAFVWGINWYRYLTFKTARRLPERFEQKFYFDDTGMVAQGGTEKVVHQYGEFWALAETEDYFVLFLNKFSGYILSKAGFLQGDPAKFGAFLKEKTGKELPLVKI